MFVKYKFELNTYTQELIHDLEPNFGYDGFGEFLFYRTYSRNLNGHQENWADCVIRVINGIFTIRKDWYLRNYIPWDEKKWQKYAKKVAISMFKMEWLPPGRGLWAMGTDFIYERGSMALYNCSFTNITNDLFDDLAWSMDSLMLGVGVGFDPIRSEIEFKNPKGSFEYIIPDSREGWVESCRLLGESYIYGSSKPRFIYDEVRPSGLPINGFGGTSSGPEPLKYYHQQIEEAIDRYMADVYYDSVIFKTDLINQQGCCVVAGNVRRCFPGFVVCNSSRGLVQIQHIKVGDKVQTLNAYKTVINVFPQGIQKLVSVILENGKEIKCTLNHRFAVLLDITGEIDWVEAKDLQETDVLLLNHVPCQGKELNINEAYFHGVFSGDGNVYYNKSNSGWTTTIACASKENLIPISDRVRNYIEDTYSLTVHESNKGEGHNLRIYNADLAKYLLPFKIPNQVPIIPDFIYTSSIQARAAYLAGLCDADGHADRYHLCYSKYKDFLEQIRIIANSLGIDTYIETKEKYLEVTGKSYTQYCLVIRGFASRKLAYALINPLMIKQFPHKTNTKWDANIPIEFAYQAKDEGIITNQQFHDMTIESRKNGPKRDPIHKQLIDFNPDFWTKVIPCRVKQIIDLEEQTETWDIEVEDEHCFFAEGILVHNSAELGKRSIKDPVFKNLKNYELYPERKEWGWMSNNSVTLEDDEDFDSLGEVAKRVIERGEPGILNLRNFPKGRIGKKNTTRRDLATGINPCHVGENKVAVADGRGYVPIKDLLGIDTDVYCINERDEVVIRKMWNPRLTGENVKILKVIFDNGDFIRVTENHQFMLRNRDFVEAKDLVPGNRLAVMRRYIPEDCQGNSYWDKYIGISYGNNANIEHKLIAEHKFNFIGENEDIDHIDGNRLNNSPDNLKLVHFVNHNIEHSTKENNPNWSGWTSEDLIVFGTNLCRKLNRRFSIDEWRLNGPIKSFSLYRKSELGSFTEFSHLCADLADVQNDPVDTRTLRLYQLMREKGYDAEIIDGKIFIWKTCEGCKNDFLIEATRREVASCSLSCNNLIRDYTENIKGLRKTFEQKRESLKDDQTLVFKDFEGKYGREPNKEEWKTCCKEQSISSEMGRKSSPFQSWVALKSYAKHFNHCVSKVIEDGYENVYNGTVDDYHNFIIGGWESRTLLGRKVQVGIINAQCGEITLQHREVCNVDETCPTVCKNVEDWYNACRYATFYASTVSLLPTHQPSTNRVVAKNRRIGVSIIDFTGWVHAEGYAKVTKYLRKGYSIIRAENKELNSEAGIPESIKVTTMKPGGTVPKLPGKTSGMQYPNFHTMIRRVRVAQNSPIHSLLVEAGLPYEKDVVSRNTDVFEWPLEQGPAECAENVSIWQQAMNLVLLQREWADNAVSNTLNFRPKWKLIRIFDPQYGSDDPYKDYLNWLGVHAGSIDTYNQFAEPKSQEGLFLKVKMEFEPDFNIKIYSYDPNHEENALEAVLASIAPLTKSVAVLPHSAKGAYPQMPEEGISVEEYEERKSLLASIDWSRLSNSDGQDQRYCDGDSCERI